MSTPYHLGRLVWVSEKIAERRVVPAESRDVWRVFNEQMRRIDRRLSWWIPDGKGLRNYVPAFSFEHLLQERAFSEEEILSIALRLLRSLELLHSYQLAHGALHLRNMFWDVMTDRVWVTDPKHGQEQFTELRVQDLQQLAGSLLQLFIAPSLDQNTVRQLPLHWRQWFVQIFDGKILTAARAREILVGRISVEQISRILVSEFSRESQWSLRDHKCRWVAFQQEYFHLSEKAFQKQRVKEKGYRKEALEWWSSLLDDLSECQDHTSSHEQRQKESSAHRLANLLHTSGSIAEHSEDQPSSAQYSSKVGEQDLSLRQSLLLEFLKKLSKYPIGEKGFWRRPFTIEGALSEQILEGIDDAKIRESYRNAFFFQENILIAQQRKEGLGRAHQAAVRIIQIEQQLTESESLPWFKRALPNERLKLQKLRAQYSVALDNRESLLKEWATRARASVDALQVPQIVEEEQEQLEAKLRSQEERWFLPLNIPKLERGFSEPKPLTLMLIRIGKHAVPMRWIPHSVGLGMWVSLYPVTQQQYHTVVGENPSRFQNPRAPVEMVSWWDCIRFCNTISDRIQLEPAYFVQNSGSGLHYLQREEQHVELTEGKGARLLTVSEWKVMARANRKYRYAGGGFLSEVGWSRSNSKGSTHSVGQKRPNSWGLYDMSGNVEEWCWDQDELNRRARCGGSWYGAARNAEIERIQWGEAEVCSDNIGFRIAIEDICEHLSKE